VTYDELRQRNRAEHASKFAGTKPRNGSSSLSFYFLLSYFLLDAPSTNIPASIPAQDNKQLPPLPIISNQQAYNPTPTNPPPKRSNVRKNQYGDEVYD